MPVSAAAAVPSFLTPISPPAACTPATQRRHHLSGVYPPPSPMPASVSPPSLSSRTPVLLPMLCMARRRWSPMCMAARRDALDSRTAALAKKERNKEERSRAFRDFKAVAGVVSALFAGLAVCLHYADADLFLDEELNVDTVSVLAGLMLAISFQFSSPYQLLLVFFGRFETHRPVDWVAERLSSCNNPDSNEIAVPYQIASAAIIGSSGFALSAIVSKYIGDTWALSTAVGTAFFSFLYEVGRPRKLSVEEAETREETWRDFHNFADASLVKAGSTHESEIIGAFVSEFPQYKENVRGEQGRKQIRRFLSKWNPCTERTPYGFYKNVAFSSTFKEGMIKSLTK